MKKLESFNHEKFVLTSAETHSLIGGGPGVEFSGHEEVSCIDGHERSDFVRTDICFKIQDKE